MRSRQRTRYSERVLNEVTSGEVGKLTTLVAISIDFLEPEVLQGLLDSGQFEEILVLPRPAFAILRDKRDPNVVIEWGGLAGATVGQVVTAGLHFLVDPSNIGNKESLNRVLAIEHRGAIKELLDLNPDSRDRVLKLPTDLARELLTSMPDAHLAWFTEYLTELRLEEAMLMPDFALAMPDVLPILSVSHNLRSKLPGVLTLAERNPDFQAILDETTATAIEKLANLTAIAEEVLPREVLEAEIKNGKFGQVLQLPEIAFDILKERGDLSVVIDWAALASDRIEEVVATSMHRFDSPKEFSSRDLLYKTLDLEDSEAIRILMQFGELQRVVLLSMSTEVARSALLSFSKEDLSWLAILIAEMAPAEKNPTVSYLLERPELLPVVREQGDLSFGFPRLILLSLDVPRFMSILDSTPADSIPKLAALVSAADVNMAADELRAMIESGQFETIFSLPEEVFEILRAKGEPAAVLAWAALAGEELVRAVEADLWAVKGGPDSFSGREELIKVLNLGDKIAMQKAMTLDPGARETILELAPDKAKDLLLTELPHQTLIWLATYVKELRPSVQQLLGRLVVEKSGLAEELESSGALARDLPVVLDTALLNSRFMEILDSTGVDAIAKLTDLLVLAKEVLSPELLVETIESGQFEIILALPQEAFEILREKADPDLVIRWADLAGDSLVQVVEAGLFHVVQPGKFLDKGELDSVLVLSETAAMEAAMELDHIDRNVLLSLTPERAKLLLTSLDFERLTWLIQSYLAHLSGAEKELLVGHVLDHQDLLLELEHGNIRRALLESDNSENLLIFLAQRAREPGRWWPTVAMLAAAAAVASGDLPVAFYNHYFSMPSLVLLMVVAIVVVLAFVVTRRTRKPVQQLT